MLAISLIAMLVQPTLVMVGFHYVVFRGGASNEAMRMRL